MKREEGANDVHAQVPPLLKILATQQASHHALRELIRRKREAIRTADIDAITKLCEQERALVQRIGDVESQRLALVGQITEQLAPGSSQPRTLREIADAAGEPLGAQLVAQADALRSEIEAVGRESSVVTAAAAALSRHMSGLMQTVQSALSRVGVYERRGRIAVASQMDFCVDVKS